MHVWLLADRTFPAQDRRLCWRPGYRSELEPEIQGPDGPASGGRAGRLVLG